MENYTGLLVLYVGLGDLPRQDAQCFLKEVKRTYFDDPDSPLHVKQPSNIEIMILPTTEDNTVIDFIPFSSITEEGVAELRRVRDELFEDLNELEYEDEVEVVHLSYLQRLKWWFGL